MFKLETYINEKDVKLEIPILIDDSISAIYEKLFYLNKKWNKNFISISLGYPGIEDRVKIGEIDVLTPILFINKDDKYCDKIYVDVLFDNILKFKDEGDLSNMYLLGNTSDEYNKFYEKVIEEYTNISKDELWEVLRLLVGDILKKTYNLDISDMKFSGDNNMPNKFKEFVVITLNEFSIFDIMLILNENDSNFDKTMKILTEIINKEVPGFSVELTAYLIKRKINENSIFLSQIYGIDKLDVSDYIKSLYSYNNILVDLHNRYVKKHKTMMDELSEYHKYILENSDYEYEYDYSLMKLEFIYQRTDKEGEVLKSIAQNKILNLVKTFNVFELSEDIPFIIINNKYTNTLEPLSRIYNGTTATTQDINNWIISRQTNRGDLKYKKIKGIQFRYKLETNSATKKYINISINEYGRIYFIIDGIDKIVGIKKDYDTFLKTIKKYINIIIDKINKIPQITRKNIVLDNLNENYALKIKSIDIKTKTVDYLHGDTLRRMLNNRSLSDLLFTYKDTVSDTILSLFYNKFNKNTISNSSLDETSTNIMGRSNLISYGVSDEDSLDINGITVTVRDNLYETGSIVEIYNIQDIYQVNIIATQLTVVIKHSAETLPQQLIRDAPIIGSIRDEGGNISATKCQKSTQPFIIMKEEDHKLRYSKIAMYSKMKEKYPDTYTISREDIEYYCQHDIYPYPGFKQDGDICCYKKDQRNKPTYNNFLQPELYDTFVQPSNLLIKLSRTDEITGETISFNTYVLKTNSTSQPSYHYLNDLNKLSEIKDKGVIELLNERLDIWLDEVSLKEIVTSPTKQYCPYIPNVYNKSMDDINKPCQSYPEKSFFGYNQLNSRPCCFDTVPNQIYKPKEGNVKISAGDIITGELTLQKNKLGELYEEMSKIFNEKLQQSVKYYRLGNVQGQYSLINSIISNITNSGWSKDLFDKDLTNSLKNSVLFIEYIKKYLLSETGRGVIYKLNNSLLIEKIFGKSNDSEIDIINKYIEYLKNKRLNSNDIIDIIQIILKVQIHIIEIPIDTSQKTKSYNYFDIKLICKNSFSKSSTTKNIILIKKDIFYESIIQLGSPYGTGYYVNGLFENDSIIINFFTNYYKDSCIKVSEYPSNYKENFLILQDKDTIITAYEKAKLKTKGQIIDTDTSKILYIWMEYPGTKYNILIPVIQNSISSNNNIETYTIKDIYDTTIQNQLIDINDLYSFLNINQSIYSIIGYTTRIINNDNYIDSVWTNYAINVPVKMIKESELKSDIKKMKHKFYTSIINKADISTYEEIREQINTIDNYKKSLIEIKRTYGEILSNPNIILNSIKNIKDLVEFLDMPGKFYTKYKYIKRILFKIFKEKREDFKVKNISNEFLDIIISYIAKEIVEDVDRSLINNIIIDDFNSVREIMKRNTETIFTNYEDVYRWLKNYRSSVKK